MKIAREIFLKKYLFTHYKIEFKYYAKCTAMLNKPCNP